MPPLWKNRDYMLLWSGQIVSTFGSMGTQIVYPLLILALTDSPAVAGIAAAFRFVPYLVFSLPVGALIDRWDRKRVMVLSDAGRLAAVATIPVAMAFDVLTVAQIYAVSLVEGSLFVFFNIAEVAALPRVVERAQLPQATAQNEAGFGVAHIVGPTVATFLFQTFGRAVPFIVDAASYAVSLATLLAIRTRFQSERAAAAPNLRQEIADGLRWLWSQRLIRFMAFLTGGVNVVGAAMPLILIVLSKELGASDADVGIVFSIGGMGAILGSLVGGQLQRRFSFGQVVSGSLWILTALFFLYLAAPSFIVVGIVTALAFSAGPIYNVAQFSYRVALIPDALQGRVNSVFRLIGFGFMPLGAALSGFVIELIGVRGAIVGFGVFLVVLSVVTTMNPHVRNAPPIERA
jgi:predicted MFS family arabinose efflux permease